MDMEKWCVLEFLDGDNKGGFDLDKINRLDECFESFILSHPNGKHI